MDVDLVSPGSRRCQRPAPRGRTPDCLLLHGGGGFLAGFPLRIFPHCLTIRLSVVKWRSHRVIPGCKLSRALSLTVACTQFQVTSLLPSCPLGESGHSDPRGGGAEALTSLRISLIGRSEQPRAGSQQQPLLTPASGSSLAAAL